MGGRPMESAVRLTALPAAPRGEDSGYRIPEPEPAAPARHPLHRLTARVLVSVASFPQAAQDDDTAAMALGASLLLWISVHPAHTSVSGPFTESPPVMLSRLCCPAPATHLAEQPAPVQPPQHEGDDEQQQQNDGHQAADQDGGGAPLGLGHGLLTPGLQLWWGQEGQNGGQKVEGMQGGLVHGTHTQDRPRGCSPKLLRLVGCGPGGHQGAGGKVPPRAREESFTTSGKKEEEKARQRERRDGGLQENW